MSKRKEISEDAALEDDDVVNVDFDFFDIVEDDFLSLKSLLRQLLGVDSVLFNLSNVTQLLVDAKVGTTVKADDKEYNDALAVLSIVDFDCQQGETAKLLQYWIERNPTQPELVRALHRLAADPSHKVGMIVCERFLNMPYEVMPPLYNLLAEEVQNRQLGYDYLLLPSRVYVERESDLDGKTPSSKRGAGANVDAFLPFHPEDMVIDDVMLATAAFAYKTPVEETDSRRAFQDMGIHPYGKVSVLEARRLPELAAKVSSLLE